jgi:hypothetical protein
MGPIYRVRTVVYDIQNYWGSWTLSIVRNYKYYKIHRFGNWDWFEEWRLLGCYEVWHAFVVCVGC